MQSRVLAGLALVLGAVLATACGGYSSSAPTAPTGSGNADVVITILGIDGGMSFAPASATVKVGQTVAWRNADTTIHDVAQDAGAFETAAINESATSRAITMTTAGTFPYHCTIHPTMVGTLTVTQ